MPRTSRNPNLSPNTSVTLSISEARRIALAAQGFDRPRPEGRVDIRHLKKTINRLGLLQIDSVNVLERAHYVPLFSRLGPYDKARLDDLLYRDGEFTEQWAHEASHLPVDAWPLLRHRMAKHRYLPRLRAGLKKHPGFAKAVLDQIRDRGPLSADDLIEPGGRKKSKAWGWGVSVRKAALEMHFFEGRISVTHRMTNFQKVYDLTERVVPAEHLGRAIDEDEAERELIRRAARAYGVATDDDLADYYRTNIKVARERIAELVEEGELTPVRVEGWTKQAYLAPGVKVPSSRRERRNATQDPASLVCPFDPVVWYRPRAQRLWDFEYRIEIYVPAAKRRWGYYVLPFLMGDRLVARVDLKADRQNGKLLVLSTHFENGVKKKEVGAALKKELKTMAEWLGLG